MKYCHRCSSWKSKDEFHKSAKTSDGLQANCKSCREEQRQDYKARNPEADHNRYKNWFQKNPNYYKEKHSREKDVVNQKKRETYNNDASLREKISKQGKKYREENKEKVKQAGRSQHLKHKYNLTLQDYEAMYKQQKGLCAICGTHQEKLHVDHNHKSGEVRSLLCGNCNRAIGIMDEDISIIQKAANYLRSFIK
jgi:hypothetical protein